jgi:ABC-type polysaccharide/polyol phosphate transport system ATPase subunit/ABC-type polysaccharide/polyol phosphate export permease
VDPIAAHEPGAAATAARVSAVSVDHVSKAFPFPHRPGAPADLIQALDDISLSVARGEFLGIVGRNGSGKSTLLKCLAGIYGVDQGEVGVEGRLSPFLELGVGFSPELSARDNVMISATMLGLSRGQVRDRFDSILAFAELKDFADLQLKNFSSGMKVRLAFSIAIQVDADVLLFDEVLAVGDASFREKCFAEFERMKGRNTILLVTHSMPMVERFCDRAVLIEQGRILAEGAPEWIAQRYYEVNEEPPSPHIVSAGRRRARPSREAGHRSHAPVAWGDDARRFLHLSATLAETSIKLRFVRSRLGLFWSVLRPLLLFAVLYAVFTQVVRFGDNVEHYELYLLTSIVLWTFFSDAASGSVGCLVARASLLRKIRFPRLAIPFSVILTALFDLTVNLLVVFGFVLASGVAPRLSWLELVPLVLLVAVLGTGMALLLSALFVRRRDVGQVWSVLQRGLFYGSGVLYPVAAFPDSVQKLMMANPLVALFTQARHVLIDPSAPTAAEAIGGTGWLVVPLGVTAGIFVLGLWIFRREVPQMAENV